MARKKQKETFELAQGSTVPTAEEIEAGWRPIGPSETVAYKAREGGLVYDVEEAEASARLTGSRVVSGPDRLYISETEQELLRKKAKKPRSSGATRPERDPKYSSSGRPGVSVSLEMTARETYPGQRSGAE